MHCIASHFLQFIPISTIRSTYPMRIGNPFAFGRTAFFIPARGKFHPSTRQEKHKRLSPKHDFSFSLNPFNLWTACGHFGLFIGVFPVFANIDCG